MVLLKRGATQSRIQRQRMLCCSTLFCPMIWLQLTCSIQFCWSFWLVSARPHGCGLRLAHQTLTIVIGQLHAVYAYASIAAAKPSEENPCRHGMFRSRALAVSARQPRVGGSVQDGRRLRGGSGLPAGDSHVPPGPRPTQIDVQGHHPAAPRQNSRPRPLRRRLSLPTFFDDGFSAGRA